METSIRYKIQRLLARYINQYCLLCRQSSKASVCDCCLNSISRFKHAKFEYDLMHWAKIINALKPHQLPCLHAIGNYSYPLSSWVKQLKFERRLIYSEVLADLFVDTIIGRQQQLPQIMIPAPLHYKRYLQRQFNQARVLAQSIGSRLRVPVFEGAIFRQQQTEAQSSLDRQQRLKNVCHAFKSQMLPAHIHHVAIVDDVITTGATMQAMVSALQNTNPNLKIEVWCIAISMSNENT